MKRCSRCGTEKLESEFGKDARNKDDLRSWCKSCVTDYNREKEASPEYREKRRIAARERRKNPEYRAKEKAWREKTKQSKRDSDTKRNRTPGGKASLAWHSAKRRAEKRGEPFTLTKERIERALKIGVCELTGLAFDFEQKLRVGKGRSPLSPSVDRVDPLKPYSDDNVRIVCDWYNMAKGQLSPEQLLEYCKQLLIANNYRVKN